MEDFTVSPVDRVIIFSVNTILLPLQHILYLFISIIFWLLAPCASYKLAAIFNLQGLITISYP